MGDVFALEKGGNGKKRLLTSHDRQTKVVVGGGPIRLVQDANVQYQQRTEPRFECGFENIYWAVGQSQGTLTLNKLVGQKGLGNGVRGGVWEGLEAPMGAQGKEGCNVPIRMTTANGGCKGDGVCQNATISFNVGNMAIQDNVTFSLGNLEKA